MDVADGEFGDSESKSEDENSGEEGETEKAFNNSEVKNIVNIEETGMESWVENIGPLKLKFHLR